MINGGGWMSHQLSAALFVDAEFLRQCCCSGILANLRGARVLDASTGQRKVGFL